MLYDRAALVVPDAVSLRSHEASPAGLTACNKQCGVKTVIIGLPWVRALDGSHERSSDLTDQSSLDIVSGQSNMDSLLDPTTINQAEALGLQARYVVDGYMAGEHKSPFRGFSIEFTQHREYVPGDDTRRLDWKVLGRTERYFIKQYEQETNFVAHVLLDGSESMQYGSGTGGGGPVSKKLKPAGVSKFDYARVMAACLSYLILQQRDAVTLGIFDQSIRQYVPRTSNLASIHSIMATLSAFRPAQATGIGEVLHGLSGQVKRRGIVIVISDLFDDEQKILDGLQHLRFGGSEVIVFHTMDPYELEFPFAGNVEFAGLEPRPGATPLRTRPAEIRKTYLAEMNAFRTRLREGCERNSTHYVPVNTGAPLSEVLTGYLVSRQRMKR